MANKIVEILDIKINNVDMAEAKSKIDRYIQDTEESKMIVTPNAEMIVRAREDKELAAILNGADLRLPDGAGVVLASHIFKTPVRERVAGFDLMVELFSLAAQRDYTVYLLGGEPGVTDKAAEKIKEENRDINLLGTHHGYLDQELQKKVLKEINQLKPDLLFVGMGVPLQEKFLNKNLPDLDVKVAVTVGGSFDVLAGEVDRAPLWMQKIGMEWFYRLLQEPERLGRMMSLPRFVYMVLKERLFKG